MAEPPLGPCAAIVRRYDPELFHAALFAPEPLRERLMVLYAFDIELSRAAARADRAEPGPIIARMRLQFWRDVVTGAGVGAHEVAAPLTALIGEALAPRALLDGLIEAREMELAAPFDRAAFDAWLAARFGGLTRLATGALGATGAGEVADAAGRAVGTAFALRLAAPMAVQSGLVLLPDLTREAHGALMRGETNEALRLAARALAAEGLTSLRAARAGRREVGRAAVPAFLHLWRAELDLRAALRPGFDMVTGFPDPGGTRRALTLMTHALTGRW
ncbi:squalene/phytoene synthase family protein [Limibaculum sp. FT325]|uniref:squalene/phytoene synthase family protein n=1 Tax=Thermohalobaculum sediminis TaxID=2939436 RepID=UPI0020C0CF6A|nr:squalene/phytoene synthase family protein [Limibaculum sediminis]MCL5778765.1 squalene/phytoene synthase family protein [Limibaculum sediminis]